MKPRYAIILCTWIAIIVLQVHKAFLSMDVTVTWYWLTGYETMIYWYFKDLGIIIERCIYIWAVWYVVSLGEVDRERLKKDKGVRYILIAYLVICAWDIFEYMAWANLNWDTTKLLIGGYAVFTTYFLTRYKE